MTLWAFEANDEKEKKTCFPHYDLKREKHTFCLKQARNSRGHGVHFLPPVLICPF